MNKNIKHNIIIINKSKDKATFKKYKQTIFNTVNKIVSVNFTSKLNLKIIVKDHSLKDKLTGDEFTDGYTIKMKNWFIITIMSDVLSRIKCEPDDNVDLDLTIYHEMTHVYDLCNIYNNKYYKFPNIYSNLKTITNYILKVGINFWTEIFAYSSTFKIYSCFYKSPTFLQLVKRWEEIEEDYKNLSIIEKTNHSNLKVKGEEFFEKLKKFNYMLAKYLGAYIEGKTNNTNYCKKTQSKKSFKFVENLFEKLLRKIAPFYSNMYGKGMAQKIYNLGAFLITNVCVKPFNIIPEKRKGKVALVFYEVIKNV